MKKVVTIILALIFISTVFVGCRKGVESPVFDKDDQWTQNNIPPAPDDDEPSSDDPNNTDDLQETSAETEPVVDTWQCAYCNAYSTGNYCSSCGRPRPSQKWFCPTCGQANKQDTNVCIGCGAEKIAIVDHRTDETLNDFVGKYDIIMVNVWTTWCAPCLSEVAALEAINQDYSSKGVKLVSICADVQPSWQTINSVMSKNNATYTVILMDKTLEKQFPVTVVPTTYFLNKKGEIIGDKIEGVAPDVYRKQLNSLLQDLGK